MDGTITFTTGLSEGIAWPWPIAVYLFLAGISGGAVAVALMLNFFKHKSDVTPILKSASIIGLATILLGMLCLVLDLTNPLYFWRILVYYNPTSVMSIGVMLLLFYIPLVAVLFVMCFADTFSTWPLLGWIKPVCEKLEAWKTWINAIVMVLALAICAYTGFLISALIRFPLINTAVLPALFVASGISAGMAATKILAAWFFGAKETDPDMHAMHQAEWPVMATEAFCLFMIAIALLSGNESAKLAFSAFTEGVWAVVFWVGAVCVGFGVPLLASIVAGSKPESKMSFYFAGLCAIGGMMCLRLFILYAGQMNTLV
ncbi:MAG: polysulfide reductase NrfD [Burkholderiales bacterium]|nr:polysulfide reductase NrfD [Burkholderiales bacterium]